MKKNYHQLPETCIEDFSAMDKSILEKFKLTDRFVGTEKNVWVEIGNFAAQLKEFNPVDLGQGFPNLPPVECLLESFKDMTLDTDYMLHQTTKSEGHLRLTNALSTMYSKLLNIPLDSTKNVLITCGAYESLYCAIVSNLNEGDEMIIIEPFFDCYEPMVMVSGGVAKFIALENVSSPGDTQTSASWSLDEDELRSMFNERTKLIVLNNPTNPIGKVYTMEELSLIAELCIQYNVVCISDEVYEWEVYKPAKHIRTATLPGMWERTLTIGSAGKTFSMTGWKCGWTIGPDYLIENCAVVHAANVGSYIAPIQEVVARCFEREIPRLGQPDSLFEKLPKELCAKRDYFVSVLREAGFKPIVPDGSYFIMADWNEFDVTADLSHEEDPYKDFKFSKWLAKNVNVLSIPPSVFYTQSKKHIGENFLRFCFYKTEETLMEARKLFLKWKSRTSQK